jgi:hypothetical protein
MVHSSTRHRRSAAAREPERRSIPAKDLRYFKMLYQSESAGSLGKSTVAVDFRRPHPICMGKAARFILAGASTPGDQAMSTTAPERRRVNYTCFQDLEADAEKAVQSKAPTTGNWSLGQILEHLAISNEKSIDGFGFAAPRPVQLIARLLVKKRVLKNGLKPGVRLPATGQKQLVPGETDPAAALDHLRRSLKRLQSESKRSPHPFFGSMTEQESNRLMLRHGELHMSFVKLPPN